MNSIPAAVLLIAILSLCNLTDKSKPATNSTASNTNSTEKGNKAAGPDHPNQSNSNSNNPAKEREALKVELMKIEYDVTTASFAGDTSTLAAYVADDYTGSGVDGRTQNKKQLLAATKPDRVTKDWRITDGEVVSSTEDLAVLAYIQTQTLKDGRTFRARVTDTFVKRDGRWLVKSEKQTLIK